MLKTIHLIKKKPELTFEEFKRYWLEEHAKIVKKLPGLKRYVINIVTECLSEYRPYDGVAELDFEDEESFKKAMESPVGQATKEDLLNFAEYADVLFVEEKVIKKPRAKPVKPKKKPKPKKKKVKARKAVKRKPRKKAKKKVAKKKAKARKRKTRRKR